MFYLFDVLAIFCQQNFHLPHPTADGNSVVPLFLSLVPKNLITHKNLRHLIVILFEFSIRPNSLMTQEKV